MLVIFIAIDPVELLLFKVKTVAYLKLRKDLPCSRIMYKDLVTPQWYTLMTRLLCPTARRPSVA
jgi:CBS-domain-containing membrane protein